jgi:Fur family transcriptional regulator, iron response regulator
MSSGPGSSTMAGNEVSTVTGNAAILPLCSFAQVRERLQKAGLRPTRQRVTLAWLLFARGDRHVTAEMLFEEGRNTRTHMSLATVYNTLRQFSEAGLLREIALYASTVWYDTNTGPHYHFYVEDSEQLVDIPACQMARLPLPPAPEGMDIIGVDMIVRVKAKSAR